MRIILSLTLLFSCLSLDAGQIRGYTTVNGTSYYSRGRYVGHSRSNLFGGKNYYDRRGRQTFSERKVRGSSTWLNTRNNKRNGTWLNTSRTQKTPQQESKK